jgi:biotin operon repressor
MRVASARRQSGRFDAMDAQIRAVILDAITTVTHAAARAHEHADEHGQALVQIRALEQLILWTEHEIGRHAVHAAAEGCSLADIGEALGMSKQAVAHKFRYLDDELRQARAGRSVRQRRDRYIDSTSAGWRETARALRRVTSVASECVTE